MVGDLRQGSNLTLNIAVLYHFLTCYDLTSYPLVQVTVKLYLAASVPLEGH